MTKIRTHRDLIAWQRGMKLASVLYRATQTMPADERFGLTSQMRRAAVSVPSNIAEGFGRGTRPEFLKYLRVARGSLFELQTQLEIAHGLGFLERDPELMDILGECDRVLQGLINSLNPSRGDRAEETQL